MSLVQSRGEQSSKGTWGCWLGVLFGHGPIARKAEPLLSEARNDYRLGLLVCVSGGEIDNWWRPTVIVLGVRLQADETHSLKGAS
jgi:hypothetical protein